MNVRNIPCSVLDTLMIFLLIVPDTVIGTFWSWALSEPDLLAPVALAQVSSNETDGRPADVHRSTAAAHLNSPVSLPCRNDRICGRGRFCDVLYGRCERLKRRGEFCRKTNNCQRNHECVFGLCRKEIPKGQEGSRCSNDDECGENQCCARQHGEFVCKARLKRSMKCFVPAGGLDYSLNEQCPCESGLICQYDQAKAPSRTAVTKKPRKNDWFQFSSDTDQMRCLPVDWPADDPNYDDGTP